MNVLCVVLLAMFDTTELHLDAMIARIAELYVMETLGVEVKITAEDIPQTVVNAVTLVIPQDGELTSAQGERVVQAICRHRDMQELMATLV